MKLVDVSVPIRDAMAVYRGNPPVRIRRAMTLRKDGVNLSELCLGSHTGTHVDAPSHFMKDGKGIDRVDLDRFIGLKPHCYRFDILSICTNRGGLMIRELIEKDFRLRPTNPDRPDRPL